MLWPFAINWVTAPTLRLEWLTEVQLSRDDTELCFSLRDGARRTLQFETIVGTDAERVLYENLLISQQANVFQLPWWPQQVWVTQPVNVGDIAVAVTDTTGRDFVPGSLVALVHELRVQLATVESANGNSVTLTDDVDSAWPLGTKVVPVFDARIQSQQSLRYKTDVVMTAEVQFDAINEWTATYSETGDYLNYPVLTKLTEASDDLVVDVSRNMNVVDNKSGRRYYADLSGYSRRSRPHRFVCDGITEVVELFNWLTARRGRVNPFWLPTQQRDFTVTQNISAAATQIMVTNQQHNLVHGQPGRNHVFIKLKNGTVFHRRISAVEVVNVSNERITINASLGIVVNIADIEIACYLQLMRLSSDAVEVRFDTDSIVTCVVGLTSKRDDV